MSSAHIAALSSELQVICAEIRSDKLSSRNKGLTRLETILNSQKSDVCEYLVQDVSAKEVWSDLFRSVIESIFKHVSKMEDSGNSKALQTLQNKNGSFISVVSKIVTYSIEVKVYLSCRTIVDCLFSIFHIKAIVANFGQMFFQIVNDGILDCKDVLFQLQTEDYKRLIAFCFKYHGKFDKSLSFSCIKCANKIVENVMKYVQLTEALHLHLVDIQNICSEEHDLRAQSELIKLTHSIVKYLALDYHKSIYKFLQKVMPRLCSYYNFRLREDIKDIFFQLCAFAINIYKSEEKSDEDSKNEWKKIFLTFFSIVEAEIKEKKHQFRKESNRLSESFTTFASNISYMIFWSTETSNPETHRKKIMKKSDKLQGLMDLICPTMNQVDFRWFSIVSVIISENVNLVTITDIQPLLQLVVQSLELAKFAEDIATIRQCCDVLLSKEPTFQLSDVMNVSYYNKQWEIIKDVLLRDSSSKNDIYNEKQTLIQLLLRYNKITNQEITSTLLKFLISTQILKTDATIHTIINILRFRKCYITDELLEQILMWLFPKVSAVDTRVVLSKSEEINPCNIAELCTLLVLDGVIMETKQNSKDANSPSYVKNENDRFQTYIKYKYLKKLICIENNPNDKRLVPVEQCENSDVSTANAVVINENRLDFILQSFNFEGLMKDADECDASDVVNTLLKVEILLELLRNFLSFNGMELDQPQIMKVTKRIGFGINHLGQCLYHIQPNKIELSILRDILSKLGCIFSHQTNVRIKTFLNDLDLRKHTQFLVLSSKQRYKNISDDIEEIQFKEKLVLKSLCYLAHIEKDESAFDCIEAFKFDLKNDLHIKYKFELVQILCQLTSRRCVADWMMDYVIDLCKDYHNNFDICEDLVKNLPSVIHYVKYYDDLMDNMCVVLSSFMKKCYKGIYSSCFVRRILLLVKELAKAYPNSFKIDNFKQVYTSTIKFLVSSSLVVRFAAIEVLAFLLMEDWIENPNLTPSSHFPFSDELFFKLEINAVNEEAGSDDEKINHVASNVQTLFSLFHNSFSLRKKTFLKLCEFAFKSRIEPDIFRPSLAELSRVHGCDCYNLFSEYFESLFTFWLDQKYPVECLPWYFTHENQIKYFNDIKDILSFSILRKSPKLFTNLSQLLKFEVDKNHVIKTILPRCYSFCLPHLRGWQINDRPNYENEARNIINNVFSKTGDINNVIVSVESWKVIFHLTSHMWDDKQFVEFFGFSFYFYQDEMLYNIEVYNKSIKEFLDFKYSHQSINLSELLKSEPKQMIRLLAEFKKLIHICVCIELKIIYLYRFCSVIKLVLDSFTKEFWKENYKQIRKYLVRDVIYSLKNIFSNVDENIAIRRGALLFMKHICQVYLIDHLDVVCLSLQTIVRSMTALIVSDNISDITQSAIGILNCLIIENSEKLKDEIVLLDEFPKICIFESIRTEHQNIKKKYLNSPKLHDDIEIFLKVADRGIEGLKAMKEKIREKKNELVQISCNHNAKTSYYTDENIIHTLICYLLKVVKTADTNVSLEGARCLGELGPIKLNTFVLSPNVDQICYETLTNYEDGMSLLLTTIMKQMDQLLLSPSPDTLVAATDICEEIIFEDHLISNRDFLTEFPLFGLFSLGRKVSKGSLKFNIEMESTNLINQLKSIDNLEYKMWISKFTSIFYNSLNLTSLLRICGAEPSFCEKTLTPLIQLMLATKDDSCLTSIEDLISFYFNENFKFLEQERATNESFQNIYTDKSVIKCFLNIAECVRTYNYRSYRKIKINFLQIAKASLYCEAVFLALIYLEMWALSEENSKTSKEELKKNKSFQKIAYDSYRIIGCSDAILGFLDPLSSRTEYLDLQNQWSTLLMEHDACGSITADKNYAAHLRKNGFFSLSAGLSGNMETDCETLWRLGRWDCVVPESKSQESFKNNFSTNCDELFNLEHFKALKAIKTREELKVCRAVDTARLLAVNVLRSINTECTQNIYKYLCWLQLLQQVEDFFQIKFTKNSDPHFILQKWEHQDHLPYGSFREIELLLSQKTKLFELAGIRASRKIKEFYHGQNFIATVMLKVVNEAKQAGHDNLAIRNIAILKKQQIEDNQMIDCLLEDAEINFKMGNAVISKAILHHIATDLKYGLHTKKVEALRRYGEYIAETSSETFEVVEEKFLKASLKLLEKFSAKKDAILQNRPEDINLRNFDAFYIKSKRDIYLTLAKYADREYMQINLYINSEDFETKKALCEQSRKDLESMKLSKTSDHSRDEKVAWHLLFKNSVIDSEDIKHTMSKYTQYLCLAMECYMVFSHIDDEIRSSEMYRIIALWFSNKHIEQLLEVVGANINNIPSYKFIPVLNQITARLSGNDDEHNVLIQKLLVRCGSEHPHHTLLNLFNLVNGQLDSSGSSKSCPDVRAQSAEKIVKIIKQKQSCTGIVNQMETVCKVLIEYAFEKTESDVALSAKMRKLKNLEHFHCPTIDLDISISGDYHITYVKHWINNVKLVGGINQPKRLQCLCSDGIQRPQLLKGQDDLRQDAVMQQVLSVVNSFLKISKEAFERKLSLRTYKVVPLSQRSGILQWCEGTIPLGDYLSGKQRNSGAHKKYRPQDYTVTKCRVIMQSCPKDLETRYKTYLAICENIKPVLHHFFFETFLCPGVWFEKRLSYINSVATMSIVGYVLGLGDRHLQNILLDQISGELIHIDFGIAFEQGKVMPTPETVPFRLTRDIVSPMGISECEGVFRKSCETTMKVLQKKRLALLTVLEVLLYDPLYVWNINSKNIKQGNKVETNENKDTDEKNVTAHRALIRVKNKLNGMDEEVCGIVSIEAQIHRLIKDATNSLNLCRLFHGWDPYL